MTQNPSTLARRAGRIAFGAVLALGMLVLVVFAIRYGFRTMPIHAWQILVGTWFAAFATSALVRTLTGFIVAPEPTEHHEERQRVTAFVVPAVGLALIAPLTVHAFVGLIMDLGYAASWAELQHAFDGFDDWAALSLAMTGPAHITFAVLVGIRAKQLAKEAIPTSVRTIYVATVLAACVPGIVLVVPPIVVALTGLPLLPFLYWMPSIAERDREPRIVVPAAIARDL